MDLEAINQRLDRLERMVAGLGDWTKRVSSTMEALAANLDPDRIARAEQERDKALHALETASKAANDARDDARYWERFRAHLAGELMVAMAKHRGDATDEARIIAQCRAIDLCVSLKPKE